MHYITFFIVMDAFTQ